LGSIDVEDLEKNQREIFQEQEGNGIQEGEKLSRDTKSGEGVQLCEKGKGTILATNQA